jgi:hypothetical protein
MNDDLTRQLSRELHEQVDGWHGAPLTLDSVRGRAHAIRRTRRLAAAGAAALAVAAIAVPTALLGTGAERTTPDPAAPPTGVETATTGDPVLGRPYLTGERLVLTDGSVRELPRAYQSAVVLGDTALGLRTADDGVLLLEELDDEGAVVETTEIDSGVTYNADESAIAYVTDGELVARWEGGQASFGEQPGATPVRLVGGPDCTEGVNTCTIYFNTERGGSAVAVNHGAVNGVAGDPVAVTDVAEDGRVAMITAVNELPEPGSCSAVFDPASGERVHDTCDHTFGRFSPDGSLLSATHPYRDGFGDGWRSILDAETGEELARYEGEGGITRSVWEDDDHLLITSWEEGEWRVTRLGADGTTEVVLGPEKGKDHEPTYAVLGAAF